MGNQPATVEIKKTGGHIKEAPKGLEVKKNTIATRVSERLKAFRLQHFAKKQVGIADKTPPVVVLGDIAGASTTPIANRTTEAPVVTYATAAVARTERPPEITVGSPTGPQLDENGADQASSTPESADASAAGTTPDAQQPSASRQTERAPTPAPNSPRTRETTSTSVQKPPEAQPANQQAQAENIPTVAEMEARLKKGITIGGVVIKIDADHQTPASACAQGIREFVTSRGDVLSLEDQALLRYMINTAQVAGVSKDQLRAELDDLYPREPTKDPDTGEDLDKGNKGVDQKVLNVLGLPNDKPANPQEASPKERADAEEARRAAIGDIIKSNRQKGEQRLPIEKLLPEEDVRQAARGVVNSGLHNAGLSPEREEELRKIMLSRPLEQLALIIADPSRFATREGLKMAEMVRKRVKYTKGYKKAKTPGEREQISAEEQFTALVATQDQLDIMKDRYKALSSIWWTIIRLLSLSILIQGYDIILGEVGQVGQGKIQ